MTPDRIRRLGALIESCVDLEPDSWAARLESACPDDAELRAEAERILHSAGVPSSFRGELGAGVPGLEVPPRIGPFRTLGILGSGGMGTVFLAEQDHPRRTVALEVLRAASASDSLRRRSEHEARALARLDYPNIARIFEAGSASVGGVTVPYFAMERVDGEPLTRYAARSGLDIRARVMLLVQVCGAVHHAHRRGLIHRDLKPGNILVDAAGRPRVLDFGLARAVGEEDATAGLTRAGQLLGTLPYMSPEQACGDGHDVDTRADVYALGVIGYELLCGHLPLALERSALPDALKAIRDDVPPPLGRWNRALCGDLEAILAKALEKNRERRYGSASDLAADLQRFLDLEPVAAGFVATLRQTARALEQREKTLSMLEFLKRSLETANPREHGAEMRLADWLDDAEAALRDTFEDEPAVRGDLLHTLGHTWLSLGVNRRGRDALTAAFELRTMVHGRDDARSIESATELGWAEFACGDLEAAAAIARHVVAHLPSAGPGVTAKRLEAESLEHLAATS